MEFERSLERVGVALFLEFLNTSHSLKAIRLENLAPTMDIQVSDEIGALEQQKAALVRAYKIAQAVEQLHRGFQAILLLEDASQKLSAQAIRTFKALSEKTQHEPSNKLQATLEQLNKTIKQKLDEIIEIASSEDYAFIDQIFRNALDPQQQQQSLSQLFDVFKRSAQTAVAIRVILQKRGVKASPLALTVSKDQLLRHLSAVEKKEKQCRIKLIEEIKYIQQETARIADNENLPPQTRDAARNALKYLQHDLDHIASGKHIEELPHLLEVVEIDAKKRTRAQQPNNKPDTQPLHPEPPQASHKTNKGVLFKIWRWMTTPFSVTWKDINNRYKQ